MWMTPADLTDGTAALTPLTHAHQAELSAAAADGDLDRLWYTSVPTPEGVEAEITRRLSLQQAGSMVPFAILNATGHAVGMTTFMNIDHVNMRAEIGSTWYRKSVQRTGLNTRIKRLMLAHAFEAKQAIAVEFRTHFLNRQSRTAIERLGARLDGVLRSHMLMPNGTLRDTAVYSITATDWPAIKANLDFLISR